MTLSRRDRAAMVLALECLRAAHGEDACDEPRPLRAAAALDSAVSALCIAGHDLLASSIESAAFGRWQRARITVARLALYLRAALRADAGDFGSTAACLGCGAIIVDRTAAATHRAWSCTPSSERCDGLLSRRITTLWQLAEHRP